jgi:hypothetical protein
MAEQSPTSRASRMVELLTMASGSRMVREKAAQPSY